MFEKHLWKSDILSKDAGHLPQVFFKHFASKNQLPGFYISETLVENGLRVLGMLFIIHEIVWLSFHKEEIKISKMGWKKGEGWNTFARKGGHHKTGGLIIKKKIVIFVESSFW